MPRDKVQIAVTSVTAKPDTKPTLCIVNHILLTDKIGNISLYNKLEDIINYLVKDSTYGLFFTATLATDTLLIGIASRMEQYTTVER